MQDAGDFSKRIISLKTETKTVFYQCGKWDHKYVPDYKSSISAINMVLTKYITCPECAKKKLVEKGLKIN